MKDTEGFRNTSKLQHRTVVDDDLSKADENEVTLYTIPSTQVKFFEKDTEVYTDKNVMECEESKLIVCYKERAYHVVKDICIDKGMLSKDKILIRNGIFKPCNANKISDITKEGEDIELPIPDVLMLSSRADNECGTQEKVEIELLIPELKFSSEYDLDDDGVKEFGSLDSIQKVEANFNEFDNNILLLGEEFNGSCNSLTESSDQNGNEVRQSSSQAASEELISESPVLASSTEESNNSKVGSVTITFDFNSTEPSNVDHGRPPIESQNVINHDDVISDTSSFSSQVQHLHGESSFSAADTVSGLITFSGPIAFSGSLSLRSDSSTTSTRSFAFPILQSEWNSSPVRMAKADRRQFRNHRGWSWRQGLLCCRF